MICDNCKKVIETNRVGFIKLGFNSDNFLIRGKFYFCKIDCVREWLNKELSSN